MSYNAGEKLTAALLNALLTRCSINNTVSTAETLNNTAYSDLATVGPTVTLSSVGTLALILFGCNVNRTAGTGDVDLAMSVAISGATTVAASDAFMFSTRRIDALGLGGRGASFLIVAITPGSNTYTAKYKCSGPVTGVFKDRRLFVFAP